MNHVLLNNGTKFELPDGWIDCELRVPEDASPVVVLTWSTFSTGVLLFKRELAQWDGHTFGYCGSDQICRHVVAWAPTPKLPLRRTVRRSLIRPK